MEFSDPRRSRREVEALPEDEYFWALMEPAWGDAAGGTPGQRLLAVTTYFVRDVENGGHHQAIGNRDADELAEVVAAFERLGAAGHAEIVRHASELLLGRNPPHDFDLRRALLDRHDGEWIDDHIGPLDERMYDETKLHPNFRAYIAAHPDEFFRD
ncbi:MAG TPA: DUF4375 domain-containing protein [Longimicrobium sp.]